MRSPDELFAGWQYGLSDAEVELSIKGRFLEDWRWGASYTPEIDGYVQYKSSVYGIVSTSLGSLDH